MLPFHSTLPLQETPECVPITNEEVEELRAILSKSEEEKNQLQEKLEKALQDNRDLRTENTLKGKFIEKSNKRIKMEEKSKLNIQHCLRGANEELEGRNQERDEAIDNAHMWRELWTKSLVAEKNMQRELTDLKGFHEKMMVKHENQIKHDRRNKGIMEEMLLEHQSALKKEQEDLIELKNYIEYQDKIYEDAKNDSMHWENRFTTLAQQLENNEIFNELRSEGMY